MTIFVLQAEIAGNSRQNAGEPPVEKGGQAHFQQTAKGVSRLTVGSAA
jgi:hypothetical protein